MSGSQKAFPYAHYPQLYSPNPHKRELFAGWGSSHAVNIQEKEDRSGLEVQLQTAHHSRHWDHLTAPLPSLPLLKHNRYPLSVPEPCMRYLRVRKNNLLKACQRLRVAKGRLKMEKNTTLKKVSHMLRKYRKSMTDITAEESDQSEDEGAGSAGDHGDGSCGDIDLHTLAGSCHINLQALLSQGEGLFEDDYSMLEVNPRYSGGCLSHVTGDDSRGLIFMPRGPTLSELCTVPYTIQDRAVCVREDQVQAVSMDSMIYQVHAAEVHDQVFIGVRQETKCHLLVSPGTADAVSPSGMQSYEWDAPELPLSMSMSPYIPSESLVCTSKNGLGYVYMCKDHYRCVLGPLARRFRGIGDMWQCYYGAHPREVAVADNTGVALWDIRGSSLTGVDLMSLPHKSLHPHERVLVATRHPSETSYHIVATDYSLILLDARFPNHTVLMWSHSLLSPPQYLDVVPGVLTEDLVLLGSQSVPEVLSYPFNIHTGSRQPPIASAASWRISKMTDFAQLTSKEEPIMYQQMIDRHLDNPLVGLCGIRHGDGHQGFSVLQLSSVGDLFSQDYRCDTLTEKQTYFSGPGSSGTTLPEDVQTKTSDWMRDVLAGIDSYEAQCYRNVEASSMFVKSQSNKFRAHLLCHLCSSSFIQLTEPPSVQQVAAPSGDDSQLCYGCSNSIAFTKKLRENISQDNVLLQKDDHDLDLHSRLLAVDLEASQYDLTTQVALRLWAEEEVDDLLKQREKQQSKELTDRFEKWKKEKLKKLKEADGGSDEDEDDVTAEDTEAGRRVYTISGIRPDSEPTFPARGDTRNPETPLPLPPEPSRTLTHPLDDSFLNPGSTAPFTSPTRTRRISTSSVNSDWSSVTRTPAIGFANTPRKLKDKSTPLSPRASPFPSLTNPHLSGPGSPLAFLSPRSRDKSTAKKKPKKATVMGF